MKEAPAERAVVMPDFCQPRRGVRQTVQAALRSLRAMGIDEDQIQIHRVGGGWAAKAVVEQKPPPGTRITPKTPILLKVSAPAAIDALPFAMRESIDGAMGTDRLMPILDAPIARLEGFVNDAGGFLDLQPEVVSTGWRWIRDIFQLEPGDLPPELVYGLARFLPAVQRVAGTEQGLALGLRSLFQLPFDRLQLKPALVPLPADRQTRLGVFNGRLGIDAVIGDGVTVYARAIVVIGPVSLAVYLANQSEDQRRYREYLYRLVMPSVVLRPVEESWYVLPPERGLVLGMADAPVRLGLNSRFQAMTNKDRSDG